MKNKFLLFLLLFFVLGSISYAQLMNLKQGVTDIASGGTHDFGSHTNLTNTDVVFTIENASIGVLNLTDGPPRISIAGPDALQFSVTVQPVTPVAGFGSTTFTVRFTPTSAGVKNASISIGSNDLATPYGLSLLGTGVNNNPPTSADGAVTTLEDNDALFPIPVWNYSDVDGHGFHHVQITQLPINGILYEESGIPNGIVDPGEEILAGAIPYNVNSVLALKFKPAANANGVGYATFRFKVSDGLDLSATDYLMTINVTPVNDQPSFTAVNPAAIRENAGPQTLVGWVTSFNPGPADEAAQTSTYIVGGPSNPALFSSAPAVSSIGTLTFTSAPHAFGTSTFTVAVQDNGGAANGGVNTSLPQTFTIVVNQNNPPTTHDATVAGLENYDLAFQVADFPYADAEGDPWNVTKIMSIPAVGTLYDDLNTNGVIDAGEAITVPGYVVNNITLLKFRPVVNASGVSYALFGFQVQDGTDYSTTSNMTIDITPFRNVSPANLSLANTIIPKFEWLPATAVSPNSFNLQISTNSNFSGTLERDIQVNGTDRTLTYLEALSNSVPYYWRVRINGGRYDGCYSQPWQLTTIQQAMPYLAYPTNGLILSGNTITFQWQTLVVGVQYDLQIAPYVSGSVNWAAGTNININTTNTYYTTSLANTFFVQGGTYAWRVIAKTIPPVGSGTDPVIINYSNAWQFSIPGLPPVVALSPVGNGTVYFNPPVLYWMPLSYNPKVNQYIVRYKVGGAIMPAAAYGSDAHTTTTGIFSTTNNNWFTTIPWALNAGYKFDWQVASWDGSTALTEASYSPVESFTVYGNATFLACYPTYPSGGSITYSSTPTLYWLTNVYAPVMYYQIEIADDAAFSSFKAQITTGITTNSYSVLASANLVAGHTYYWHVRGSLDNTWGSSNWSAPASFVVASTAANAIVPTPIPTSPTSGTEISVTNPTLTWAAYSTVPLYFQVTWATNPSIDVNTGEFINHVGQSAWLSTNSCVLSGLTKGAPYYWQVQAKTATTNIFGSISSVAWFTVSAGAASVVPIAGSPINGSPINNTSATLSWVLPTQSTSTLKYDLQYSKTADFTSGVSTVSNVEKANVDVKNLDKNATYYWRVASKTSGGDVSSYSAPTSFSTGSTKITGVEQTESLPTDFELSQNYPNPFNPTTIINYALPTNSYVTLKVYDMLGREVKTLVNSQVVAGRHSIEWRGDDNSGSKVATGVYIYRVTADNFVSSKKMLLIK